MPVWSCESMYGLSLGRVGSSLSMWDRGGDWTRLESPASFLGANIFEGKAAEILAQGDQ